MGQRVVVPLGCRRTLGGLGASVMLRAQAEVGLALCHLDRVRPG